MKRDDLIREGASMSLAEAVVGATEGGRTATGNNQATAFALGEANTVFTTVAASTGARLPADAIVGDEFVVANFGASALLVYPALGGKINALADNAGFSVAAGAGAVFKRMTSTRWVTL